MKKRVLILCTGNSCRSIMAQAWVEHALGDRWEAHSAGTRPAERVHPLAVRVMAEAGVDVAGKVPQGIERVVDRDWDLVVTVCDGAREACPVFPRPVEQVHLGFPDPAAAEGSEEQRLEVFRTVSDDLRARLLSELRRRG